MTATPTEQLGFRVTPTMAAEIRAEAARLGVSIAALQAALAAAEEMKPETIAARAAAVEAVAQAALQVKR